MFVQLTRYELPEDARGDPADRFDEISARSRENADGWVGAMLMRSVDEPRKLVRLTIWRDAAARDRWHATQTSQGMGLGRQPGGESYEVLRDIRG